MIHLSTTAKPLIGVIDYTNKKGEEKTEKVYEQFWVNTYLPSPRQIRNYLINKRICLEPVNPSFTRVMSYY